MAYWLRQAGFDVVEASDTTELPGTRAARAAWAPAGQLNYPCNSTTPAARGYRAAN